jgi:hypothetical protein
MGKLPVSDKTSNFGVKPHIKKGYYPAKLLSVKPYLDKTTGELKEGTYGHQLIMDFAVYKGDYETGVPIEPIQYLPNPENIEERRDFILAKFVYHEYRNKNAKADEPKYRTAITPNSDITKILTCLGWSFSLEDVDPEDFIGNWVELNIDDYDYEFDGKKLIASGIKDINVYKGPEVKNVREAVKDKPQKVEKQVKHDAVEEDESEPSKEVSPEEKALRDKMKNLEALNKDGFLTNEGLVQARESINAQIAALKK